jgi:excisionase family DNA binding protein
MNKDISSRQVKFFSTAALARLLNIDASTVKRWADSGRLRCYRTIGGHRRFSRDQVQEFVTNYHLEGMASLANGMKLGTEAHRL